MPFEVEKRGYIEEGEYRLTSPVEFEEEAGEDFLLEKVGQMSLQAREDLAEDLLGIITEKFVGIDDQERSALLHLVRGHCTNYTIETAFNVCRRINSVETDEMIDKFASRMKSELRSQRTAWL